MGKSLVKKAVLVVLFVLLASFILVACKAANPAQKIDEGELLLVNELLSAQGMEPFTVEQAKRYAELGSYENIYSKQKRNDWELLVNYAQAFKEGKLAELDYNLVFDSQEQSIRFDTNAVDVWYKVEPSGESR